MPPAPPVSHARRHPLFLPECLPRRFRPPGDPLGLLVSRPTPPDRLLFQMEKATTISGRVLDQDQKPIAGATVVIDVSKGYPNPAQWVDLKDETTKTDANGRWSFSCVPEKPDSVKLAAYHYLCLREHSFYVSRSSNPSPRSATARLPCASNVVQQSKARSSLPTAVPWQTPRSSTATSADSATPSPPQDRRPGQVYPGHQAGCRLEADGPAPGFGPALQTIRAGTEPQRITLRLERARTLSGRVVDRAGKPIPSAQIRIKSWRGSESLDQYLKVDENGRFAWNEAPPDEVKIDVQASGYSAKNDLPLKAGHPHEITLTPSTMVKGTVLDGKTGQPIPHFSLVLGSVWDPGDHFRWQRGYGTDRQARKSPGSFEYTLGQPAYQYLLRVQAEGYLYEDSGLFSPDGTPHAFTFRLTRRSRSAARFRNPMAHRQGTASSIWCRQMTR